MSKKELKVQTKNSGLVYHDDIDDKLFKKFQEAENHNSNIQDFIQEFMGQFISKQTQKAYLTDLNLFFSFLKRGGLIIQHPKQIKGTHFQLYRDELFEREYSSATINRKLVAIRSFIKWSMALKLIDHNPLDIVKLPKVETEAPTVAFDDHEVVAMIQAPDLSSRKGQMHKLVIHILFTLGLRRSELVNIKIKDITKERGHYVLKIKGKGNKIRFLPLSPDVTSAIKQYMDAMASFNISFEKDDFLIQSVHKGKNTKPMDGSTVYRIIQKYSKSCGINKNVSPHSCRATAISHLLDTQQTPIRDVAIFAGHSKITTTERYDKRREGLDNSAAYDIDYNEKNSAS
jgi:site-specific recombinase XerD